MDFDVHDILSTLCAKASQSLVRVHVKRDADGMSLLVADTSDCVDTAHDLPLCQSSKWSRRNRDQSQSSAPPDWYSMTRVSKKFFSFFRSIASDIHGNGFSFSP